MMLWYTARGAGLATLIMLSVATALGALGSVKLRHPSTRVIAQYIHRTAAALGLGLLAVHVTSIVVDDRSGVGVAGALVPFASAYRPGSVALGSIAAYVLLLVAALGLARGRLTRSGRAASSWRALHALAYGAWAVAMLHGLRSGTDAGERWVQLIFLGCAFGVLAALTARLVALTSGETFRRAMEVAG